MSGSILPPGTGAAAATTATTVSAQDFQRVVAQVTQLPADLRNAIMAANQQMSLAKVIGQMPPQMPVVQGQVQGTDQNGATLIQTQQGQVAVKLPMPLPQGATVTLALGGTPQAPQAQVQQVQQPPAQAAQTAQTVQPQQQAPQAPQAPITQIAQTATQAQPTVQAKATLIAAPTNPQPSPSAPQAAATPAQTVQVGQSVQVRVLPEGAAAQTTQAAPQAPASNFGQTLTARVVAHTAGGPTMLETSLGRLALQWPQCVPKPAEGARLAVEVTLPQLAKNIVAGDVPLKSGAALSRDWPALKDAIKVLSDTDPGLAKRVLDDGLPRPGPKLATQVLSFLSGERTDARALLGEQVTTALERAGRGDVLQRLDGDLKEMQRQANAPGDWRAAYVPVWDGQNLSQMRLFSRRETKKDAQGRKTERFIVELDYSQFGEVQVDGLMRKPTLDLILRTHTAIPPDMRDEIEVVFLEGCSLAGLAGKIYFQSMAKFPVNPVEEIAKQDRGMMA
ncbi:MAG: hypothetical protein IBJ15_12170 [Alphaproteobacteria bacterium]|nr:hypothetical protein [Alphaproteobacteria bacterium]